MCYVHHVTKVMIIFIQGRIFDIQTSCQSTYGYTLLILNTRLLEVIPILWSIREMCCIISMLGRDAHMNVYHTHVKVIFAHISLMNCYCPLQLKRENSQVNP